MKYLNLFFIALNLFIIFWFKIGYVKGIDGGTEAVGGQFPYVVSVQANNKHICGGSIIGDLHILTAAHCVIGEDDKFKNEKFSILAGVINIQSTSQSPGVRRDVSVIYVPKEFKRTKSDNDSHYSVIGDISVFKLKNSLGLFKNSQLKLLWLPKKVRGSYKTYYLENSIIAGFGIDSLNHGIKRNRNDVEIQQNAYSNLKFAQATIAHQKICRNEFNLPKKHIHEYYLCARIQQQIFKKHIGTCKGDSGSSLVVKDNTVIGILVKSREDCDEHYGASLYTRVTDYIPFIDTIFLGVISPDIRMASYKKITDAVENSNEYQNLVEITN